MTEIHLKRAPFSNGDVLDMGATSAAPTESREHAIDIAPRDWDCLFQAIIERLRMTVSTQFASEHDAHAGDTLTAVTSSVCECVEALAQLHASRIYDRIVPKVIDEDVLRGKWQLSATMAQLLAPDAATEDRMLQERRLLLHNSLAGSPNAGDLAIG